jgi:hypothetical protein
MATLTRPHQSWTGVGLSDSVFALVLRLVAVAGLAIDVWVHASLESQYAGLGGTLTQGRLFGVEAAVAGVVGLWLLLTGSKWAWIAAFLIAASALGAVLLYRYVDVGTLGPLPNMYEPTWYFRKTLSAYAEATVVVAAAWRLALMYRDGRRSRQPLR